MKRSFIARLSKAVICLLLGKQDRYFSFIGNANPINVSLPTFTNTFNDNYLVISKQEIVVYNII